MKYLVTGPFPVAGAQPGTEVELDPDVVDIPILIAIGHVAEVTVKPRGKTPPAPSGGEA